MLKNHDAQDRSQLTLREGQVLSVIEKEGYREGWWKGRTEHNQVSLLLPLFVRLFILFIPDRILPGHDNKTGGRSTLRLSKNKLTRNQTSQWNMDKTRQRSESQYFYIIPRFHRGNTALQYQYSYRCKCSFSNNNNPIK